MHNVEMKDLRTLEDFDAYFCTSLKTPRTLANLFLEITKQLYSNAAYLERGVHTYDPANKDPRGLYVEKEGKVDRNNTDRLPRVMIDTGDIKYDPKSLTGLDGTSGGDLALGEITFNRLGNTSVTWKHTAKTKAEAELYAAQTSELMAVFAYNIKKDFCLDEFNVVAQNRAQKTSENEDEWTSLVGATIVFTDSYTVQKEALALKCLDLTITT